MPTESRAIVGRRRVRRHPVIPHHHRPRLIPRADLEVRALREVVVQELQQELGLLLAEADDVAREALVHVQRLLAGDGVHAHERVLRLDGRAAHGPAALAREVRLGDGGVHRAQALEALLERGREAVVRLDLGEEEGVAAADLGLVEDEEERGAGGLLLVGDVGVPLCVVGAVGAGVLCEAVVLGITVDCKGQCYFTVRIYDKQIRTDVELRVTLHVSRRRMPLDGAEVLGQFDLAVGAKVLEVLIAEDDDLSLCNKESELVQALLAQLRDLDTSDFGTKVRADVARLDIWGEEMGLLGVGAKTRIGVLCKSRIGSEDKIRTQGRAHIPKSSVGGNFSAGSKYG
jgi:hypothetical protein